jgi:hypothetical protein
MSDTPRDEMLRKIMDDIAALPEEQQPAALEEALSLAMKFIPLKGLREMRVEVADRPPEPCPCCGKEAGSHLLDLIDGHIALREMGLNGLDPSETG